MIAEHHSENVTSQSQVDLGKHGPAALIVGIVLVGILLGAILTQSAEGGQSLLWGSYLYGLVFWAAIAFAMFGLTVLNHAVRSTWTLSVLRILEAGGGWITLAIFGIGFLPVAANLSHIYPWAMPGIADHDPEYKRLLAHKAPYLNPGVWIAQLVVFFALWIGLSWFMRNSALKQEKTQDFQLENGRMSWGAAGLVMCFLTGTFAFIAWVMSLEPKWYSTMYGLWFTIGSSLGAYALAVTVFNLNANKKPYSDFVTKNVLKDQGNMLFVHTMLWGYTSLSQYLILWNGNLPETTSYYVRRASFGWNAWGMATIFGQFFIPFFLLLSPRTKKNSPNLRSIAGFMFFVHIIDYTLIVAPALPGRIDTATGLIPWDALSFFGFGALFVAGFCFMFRQAAPFPTYDSRLQEAKAHAH
jgi:hypothetical protein